MWKAKHFQTGEVKQGSEEEILNLDYRVWIDKHEIDECQSHAEPFSFTIYRRKDGIIFPYVFRNMGFILSTIS